jgi:hypothetical protein
VKEAFNFLIVRKRKRKENRPRGWLSGSSVVAEHHKRRKI